MLSTIKNTVSSEIVKNTAGDIYHSFRDVLSRDPVAVLQLIKQVKELPSRIRDGIFFECFEAYILNLNEYDYKNKKFIENNLKKMAAALAEVSPNQEGDYEGNPNKLREYSKRIVKLIDDCGTIQKALYLSNISRALAKKEIDKRTFFKLGQCIRMLTEEDLLFLAKKITKGIISGVDDYVDDFRSQGLMYEVEAGFAYSRRAFLLLKYALNYEGNVHIPDKFPDRNIVSIIADEDIQSIFNKEDTN